MSVRNINNFNPIPRKDFERFLTDTLRIGYFYLYIIIMVEIFKQIYDYPNYEVSNFGRLRRNKKSVNPYVTNRGYLQTGLFKNGVQKKFSVHRLVGMYFISGYKQGYWINHKDGNKTNNNVSNLEWVTPKQNHTHAVNMGLTNPNSNAKLTKEQVIIIRNMYMNKKGSLSKLALIFKCSKKNIWSIVNYKTWISI